MTGLPAVRPGEAPQPYATALLMGKSCESHDLIRLLWLIGAFLLLLFTGDFVPDHAIRELS